ncbi:MAG: type III pantothenate kinase [Betaproteobacteria bacterium]|nr:type III pantothenate kinase [Betaproteobacteria bacterium]
MSLILAIDSGNSFIKWGIHDGIQWQALNKVAIKNITTLEAQWVNLSVKPTSIVISHVSNQFIRDKLSDLLSVWPISVHWVKSIPFQCGVYNGYTDPHQLGCDRWMSLIAARQYLFQQSCLVINVGTALTVDCLSDSGQFLGGIIFPGPYLMLRSLEENTEQLEAEIGSYQDFPSCTNNAIFSGVIQSALGAIERMRSLFSVQLQRPLKNCIVSGGGAHLIVPYINFPITIIENIVLEGLAIVAKESGQS